MTDSVEVKQQPAGVAIDPDAGSSLYCPYCGYDLRALVGETCPECGGAVDEVSLKAVQVPWQGRGASNFLFAMLRTSLRVSFRTKRFCYCMCRPVSYKDARKFQLWVVTLLWLGLISTVATPIVLNVDDVLMSIDDLGWSQFLTALIPGLIGLWLFLFMATGLHTYWLHPGHIPTVKQNRAVALGYYACGPLLFAAMGCIPIDAGVIYANFLDPSDTSPHDVLVLCVITLGVLMILVWLVAFWRICFVMAGRAAERGLVGRWSLPIVQPLLITLLALLPVGLSAIALYVSMILYTF